MSKSANHYNGRNGWKPDIIVCHITEGGFAGAVSWLCNPAAQCSAHFVVGANGEKEQLVDFKDGAWCNGNTTDPNSRLYYKNSLNPIIRERAANANFYTYSIEHEGYSYKERCGALTEKQYQASLEVMKLMITDMKKTYGVTFTPDRNHLIGHYQIDPKGKPNCPAPNEGKNFPFDRFIADIKAWMEQSAAPAPTTPVPTTPTTVPTATAGDIAENTVVEFKSDSKTYYPGSTTIPAWVISDFYHVVTQTTASGKAVTKGGVNCVLLGKKINKKTGKEETGINTWVNAATLKTVSNTAVTATKEIGVGDVVAIKNGTAVYYPGGIKIPDWAITGQYHKVTQTTLNGKQAVKGGVNCVLLGKKIDKTRGTESDGINSWIATDSLIIIRKG